MTQKKRESAKQLRQLLHAGVTQFLMEAHDALSAKIAAAAGFKGLWASGLSISTSLGVRDSNELSWSQVLNVLEYMVDAVEIPIVVDGDTGHGNFNTARAFARKLSRLGIAGVCIEDNLFPKTNSFIGKKRLLADTEEFCGKIKAIKDQQLNADFCLLARTEAFIAGLGLAEALDRAEAYRLAGADAILVHSKRATADEILAFASAWQKRCPLVIVPTKYYKTPTQSYIDAEIALVIWANHTVRASIRAMQTVCKKIFADQSIMAIEHDIASLDDIFTLIDYAELASAEKKYLPQTSGSHQYDDTQLKSPA